jgi:hypothetical protein
MILRARNLNDHWWGFVDLHRDGKGKRHELAPGECRDILIATRTGLRVTTNPYVTVEYCDDADTGHESAAHARR